MADRRKRHDTTPDPWLRGLWYFAARARDLQPGCVIAKHFLDEPILLGRRSDGTPFALRDLCPHRGIPLSGGSFDGESLTCRFHGWRFGTDGRCREIPSLMPDHKIHLDRLRVPEYTCRESQGLVWIFFPKHGESDATPPSPPFFDDVSADATPQIFGTVPFDCHANNAVYNLMDPGHAAFIHGSWWWRRKEVRLVAKEKILEPADKGWRIAQHTVARHNRAYRLLGANVTSEITYHLPGLRIEKIRGDKHVVIGVSAVTPVHAHASEATQCFYSDIPWLRWFDPIGRHFIKKFLMQDREVAIQSDKPKIANFRPIYVHDVDIQAHYFAQLQAAWRKASDGETPFVNPVRRRVVRWRT